MTYVDGFVAAVPTANKEAYIAHAREAVPYFKGLGATALVECWGDDVPDGELTSFPMAVKKKDDETVIFSWVLWPSREVRMKAMEQMRSNPPQGMQMPFDGKRMIFGGFEMVVEA